MQLKLLIVDCDNVHRLSCAHVEKIWHVLASGLCWHLSWCMVGQMSTSELWTLMTPAMLYPLLLYWNELTRFEMKMNKSCVWGVQHVLHGWYSELCWQAISSHGNSKHPIWSALWLANQNQDQLGPFCSTLTSSAEAGYILTRRLTTGGTSLLSMVVVCTISLVVCSAEGLTNSLNSAGQ
jgi:hypothetical protein